ncbi:MAG: hypothetical protein WCL71_11915 [Deltaproteobacteria bacterium]
MKKKSYEEKVCEPRSEFDLEALLPGGVQGKYVERTPSFPRAAWECSSGALRRVSQETKHGSQPLPNI